jgi:hypothetical protein
MLSLNYFRDDALALKLMASQNPSSLNHHLRLSVAQLVVASQLEQHQRQLSA